MKNISHPLDTVFPPSRQELGPVDLPHYQREAEKVQNKVFIPQRVINLSRTVYLSALALSKTLAVTSPYLPPKHTWRCWREGGSTPPRMQKRGRRGFRTEGSFLRTVSAPHRARLPHPSAPLNWRKRCRGWETPVRSRQSPRTLNFDAAAAIACGHLDSGGGGRGLPPRCAECEGHQC